MSSQGRGQAFLQTFKPLPPRSFKTLMQGMLVLMAKLAFFANLHMVFHDLNRIGKNSSTSGG